MTENKPDRRPSADSLTNPPDASTGGAERYTVGNIEAWVAELRTIPQIGALNGSQLAALDNTARFLEDTAATLKAQAKIRRDKEAARILENRKANRRRGRRG